MVAPEPFRSGNTPERNPPQLSEPLSPEQRLEIAARLWNWHPHPGQQQLLTLRDGDGAEPRVLIAACGRRWGKTEAIATDAAVRLLTEPDLGQMAVAPTCDQAALLFDAVADRLADAQADEDAVRAFPVLSVLQIKQTPYPHIRRKTDGAMLFSARTAGRTGRSLRGFGTTRKVKRFRVIVDERAFVPDEAIERAIKPMLATSPGGGQLVMISSPNGRRGGFYNDFLKGEAGGDAGAGNPNSSRYRAVRLPSSQNPLVDAAFLAEMRAEMSERAFRAEFEAEFTDGAGQVFPDAEIDAATLADDYGTAPRPGATYVAGADFGRRSDYTVVCVLLVDAGATRLVGFARWRGVGYGLQAVRVAELLQHWNVARCATLQAFHFRLSLGLCLFCQHCRLPCRVALTFGDSKGGFCLAQFHFLCLHRRFTLVECLPKRQNFFFQVLNLAGGSGSRRFYRFRGEIGGRRGKGK